MRYLIKVRFIMVLSATILACWSVFAAENRSFSGAYKGRQLIPNRMAELCEQSAEDMIKDANILVDCVNKLAVKRRSTNAETSCEGLEDLKEIEVQQIINTLEFATVKGAEIAKYREEVSKDVSEANAGAKTINDSDSATINTSTNLTAVVNGMRDLYTERLKYLAISCIEGIDKETLDDIASVGTGEQAENEEESSKDKTEATASTITASVQEKTLHYGFNYKGKGTCEFCVEKEKGEISCNAAACPPSVYTEPGEENVHYVCEYVDIKNPDKGTNCTRVEE